MQIFHSQRPNVWKNSMLLLALFLLAACGGSNSYEANFDRSGKWGEGNTADVEGSVRGGVYQFLVKAETGLFWTTAGESFENGIYEVEARPVDGPVDNGYGMIFRADGGTDNFYLFEVSGDGYVWIGYCQSACETEATPLVRDGWFESKAVNKSLNTTNVLRVEADGATLIFVVNGQEVGRTSTAPGQTKGDIGLLVETLGEGGVMVQFDNFRVIPLEEG